MNVRIGEEEQEGCVSRSTLKLPRSKSPFNEKTIFVETEEQEGFQIHTRAANGKSKHLRDFLPSDSGRSSGFSAQFNLLHAKQFGRQRRLGFGQKIARPGPPTALPRIHQSRRDRIWVAFQILSPILVSEMRPKCEIRPKCGLGATDN